MIIHKINLGIFYKLCRSLIFHILQFPACPLISYTKGNLVDLSYQIPQRREGLEITQK